MSLCAMHRLFVIVISVFLAPTFRPLVGQSVPNCPVTLVPQCFCRVSYGAQQSIYCENLGRRSSVPSFLGDSSTELYEELVIRLNSVIDSVQDGAFDGLRVTSLSLQNLQIRSVAGEAFRGLEDHLLQLHLEQNLIDRLSTSSVRNLTRLQYVGLSNNAFVELPADVFRTLGEATEIDLSANRLQSLDAATFLGLGRLNNLYLSGNGLRDLRPGIFDSLQGLVVLDLSWNSLGSSLSPGVFPGPRLTSLTRLILSNNGIVALNGFLRGLRQLSSVDLSSNSLQTIPVDQFNDCVALRTINISANSIRSIAANAFLNASRLQTLYVDDNSLVDVDRSAFANLPGLRFLSINRNLILNLTTGCFTGSSGLTSLYLAGNRIERILAGWLDGLTNLQTLDLSHNRIRTVEAEAFVAMASLRTLNVQGNRLIDLDPVAFRPLVSLSMLNAYQNSISYLDYGTFEPLRNLRYLHLEYNNISEVPVRLFLENQMLETVDLSYNKIRMIDADTYPAWIKYLYLEGNFITEIPGNAFPDGMKLITLNLSSNFISKFYRESLNRLSQLLTLDMAHNNLSYLVDGMFGGDRSLLTLSLTGNRLENVTSGAVFGGLEGVLSVLQLDGNSISKISHSSLANLTKLSALSLSGNPIECNCDVIWMRSFAPLREPLDVVCAKPIDKKGQSIVCFNVSDDCQSLNTTPLPRTTSALCNATLYSTTTTTTTARPTTTPSTTTPSTTTSSTTTSSNTTPSTTTPSTTTTTQSRPSSVVTVTIMMNSSEGLGVETTRETTRETTKETTTETTTETTKETTRETTRETTKETTEVLLSSAQNSTASFYNKSTATTPGNASDNVTLTTAATASATTLKLTTEKFLTLMTSPTASLTPMMTTEEVSESATRTEKRTLEPNTTSALQEENSSTTFDLSTAPNDRTVSFTGGYASSSAPPTYGVIHLESLSDGSTISLRWTFSSVHSAQRLRLTVKHLEGNGSDAAVSSVALPPLTVNYTLHMADDEYWKAGKQVQVCVEYTVLLDASDGSTAVVEKCDVTRFDGSAKDKKWSENASRTLVLAIVIPILAVIAVALLIVTMYCLKNRKSGKKEEADDEAGNAFDRSQKVLLTDEAKEAKRATNQRTSQKPETAAATVTSSPTAADDRRLSSVTFDNRVYAKFSHKEQPTTLSFSNNALNRLHSTESINGFPAAAANAFNAADDDEDDVRARGGGDVMLTPDEQNIFESTEENQTNASAAAAADDNNNNNNNNNDDDSVADNTGGGHL